MAAFATAKVRENIIEIVSENSCLYDSNHPAYNNKTIVDPLWESIGETMDLTAAKTKSLWKNLKDSYRVQKKKMIAARRRGYRLIPDKKWHFYDAMEFVDPFIDCSSFEENDAVMEIDLGNQFAKECDDEMMASGSKDSKSHSPLTRGTKFKRKRRSDSDDPEYVPAGMSIKLEPSSSWTEPASARRHTSIIHNTDDDFYETSLVGSVQSIPEPHPISGTLMSEFTPNTRSDDPEALYGAHVAAMLRGFTPRQRQLAKMRIEQLFYDIQFPEDRRHGNNVGNSLPAANNTQYASEQGDARHSPSRSETSTSLRENGD